MTTEISFSDGAGYERFMGKWSRLVGDTFLDWLAPAPALRWLDVGCGNGAFTELIVERCAPSSVIGIDPSEAQLAYARTRPQLCGVEWQLGDAMALPGGDDSRDIAVMPLVIFFVPDPVVGVAEMARVVAPGGIIAAYAWDMLVGGFPYHLLQSEMRAMGVSIGAPPSPEASQIEVLHDLWTHAGLESVTTRRITVHRTFVDFDDYWDSVQAGPSVARALAEMTPANTAMLTSRLAELLPADADGRITYAAHANAVTGSVPTVRRRSSPLARRST